MSDYFLGVAFALGSAFMYSFASVLYRSVLGDTDPILVTALRVPAAFLVILALTMFIGEFEYLFIASEEILMYGFLAGALGMMLGAYFYMRALKYGGVSIGFPTSFSYPVFVTAIASLFLEEMLTIGILLGLASTLTGITILASSSSVDGEKIDPLRGAFNGLLAAILWALSIIVSKLALASYPPVSFATIRLLFAVFIAIPFLFTNQNKVKLNATMISIISLGGIFGIGFGIVLAHVALIYVGAIVSAIVSASSPALSILLARIFLGERMNIRRYIGVSLVIIGTLMTFF